MTIPLPIYLFVLIQISMVTYFDVKFRKISNKWSILNIATSFFLYLLFPKVYLFEFGSFQYTIVFLIVGFALFLLNIMGGGDSKYLASLYLIIPSNIQDQVFYLLLIATIFVGIIFFIKNVYQNRAMLIISLRLKDKEGVKSCFGTKFAYAPVILVTWILLGINFYTQNINY